MSELPHDPAVLPADVPVPVDDGAADHLSGVAVPSVALAATDGFSVDLAARSQGRRVVVFAYPRTGRPGEPPLVADWDSIPGARGCTPEACSFRDVAADFAAIDVELFGLSTQDSAYQREAVERLHLPYLLLSDADLALTEALRLPTMEVAGQTLLRRLTMILASGRIESVIYPVFPPDRAAEDTLDRLQRSPPSGSIVES